MEAYNKYMLPAGPIFLLLMMLPRACFGRYEMLARLILFTWALLSLTAYTLDIASPFNIEIKVSIILFAVVIWILPSWVFLYLLERFEETQRKYLDGKLAQWSLEKRVSATEDFVSKKLL